MANTKISQLPSYTGSAADLRWFVMNNSGETETYKYSGYNTSITYGAGTDSIKSVNSVGAAGTNSIAIGKGSSTAGDEAVSIGNGYNVAISAGAISIGRHPGLGAGKLIAIGSGAYISGDNSIAIGHETASSNNGIVLGGTTSRAGGGFSITLGNGNEHNLGAYSTILGTNNLIANFFYNSVLYSNGGTYNNIYSNNSKIGFTGVTNFTGNTIIGGNNNVILAEGSNNMIIGGGGNIITGTTSGTTLIGLNDITTPLLNDTAYVNNLQVLRTPSTRVQSVSSGTTFTCNLDNGAKSQFYITGTSTINITNVRDGASFMIKTQADGNHTMTWTATGGYTFLFEGGIKDPGNNVIDIFQFEVFGNVIYGSRKHNFS